MRVVLHSRATTGCLGGNDIIVHHVSIVEYVIDICVHLFESWCPVGAEG